MSLTTPVQRDKDSVLPGENWFFYWKTSASLWESKLAQFSSTKVIIPINWSFHSETGTEIDFAEKRPETDLKRLHELVLSINKEAVFLLPITPVPFLPNGGVPHLLARNLSQNEKGMVYTISDGDNDFFKLYSFFDTRIFKSYGKFVAELGKYFSLSGISSDVYGLESGFLEDGYFKSYFYDRSKVFSNAFSNYLLAKKELEVDEKEDQFISNPEVENVLKDEFRKIIFEFYTSTAKKNMIANWSGSIRISFMGGRGADFINRLYSKERSFEIVKNVFESITIDTLASSVLIDGKRKEKVLGRILGDLITNSFAISKFSEDVFDEVNSSIFKPLVLFNLFYNSEITGKYDQWKKNFLIETLDKEYKWQYQKKEISSFENLEQALCGHQIFFVLGSRLSQNNFNKMLKIFLNGGKVIVDTFNLEESLMRRLQSFIIENSLEVEKINYITEIEHAFLGEGRLIIFNGEKLSVGPGPRIISFWRKIISTFDIPFLKINAPEEIEYTWRTRDSNSKELNYEEVRRVNLYNPSSYKKKVIIYLEKNFSLLKKIDEINVNVRTNNYEIEVELFPEGSISLDFGMYS